MARMPTLKDAVEQGQILFGGPESVFQQIMNIRAQIGAGILDLVLITQDDAKANRAIELFARKVLPRLHDME